MLALVLLPLAVLVVVVAGRVAAERAEAGLSVDAGDSATLLAALLASEIEHFRAVPLVLASDDAVASALVDADAAARLRLGDRLAVMNRDINAAAIYLIDDGGMTVAASNAREPGSFVGDDYRFRSYFTDGMRDGRGVQYAMGSTTQRPGLYLSHRVERAGRALGVVVVKVEFDLLEDGWRRSDAIAMVTDRDGDVLVTTEPAWRFSQIAQILPAYADGRQSHVFGSAAAATTPGAANLAPGTYFRATASGAIPGWTIHAMIRGDDRVTSAVTAAAALTTLLLFLAGSLLAWLLVRQRRAAVRASAADAARRQLEQAVADRTEQLSHANQLLRDEIAERQRAEEAARLANEELGQANRLAILGQIAAGVTHEINQPVAAIRATADNALVMMDRGQDGDARGAVDRIAQMTDRIGAITGELRAFAAKRPGPAQRIAVDAALDGALLLLAANLRQAGVRLTRSPRDTDLAVWAERIRLEQILVNLLSNALEALADTAQPEIHVVTRTDQSWVDLVIVDNGPGIPAAIAPSLFTPFQTSKAGGLGLGLVISRDIAAELGGDLTLLTADQLERGWPDVAAAIRVGAAFCLRLPTQAAQP